MGCNRLQHQAATPPLTKYSRSLSSDRYLRGTGAPPWWVVGAGRRGVWAAVLAMDGRPALACSGEGAPPLQPHRWLMVFFVVLSISAYVSCVRQPAPAGQAPADAHQRPCSAPRSRAASPPPRTPTQGRHGLPCRQPCQQGAPPGPGRAAAHTRHPTWKPSGWKMGSHPKSVGPRAGTMRPSVRPTKVRGSASGPAAQPGAGEGTGGAGWRRGGASASTGWGPARLQAALLGCPPPPSLTWAVCKDALRVCCLVIKASCTAGAPAGAGCVISRL